MRDFRIRCVLKALQEKCKVPGAKWVTVIEDDSEDSILVPESSGIHQVAPGDEVVIEGIFTRRFFGNQASWQWNVLRVLPVTSGGARPAAPPPAAPPLAGQLDKARENSAPRK